MLFKKYRVDVPILVTALGFCTALSTMAAQNQSKIDRFNEDGNTVSKRQIISEIGAPKAHCAVGVSVMQRTEDLSEEDAAVLSRALDDSKATVVDAAVRKIGELKEPGFENKIIALFETADKKFPAGYDERVKAAIITSIGRCNGPKATQFLANQMSSNEETPLTKLILAAARETGNPLLLQNVTALREKMEMKLKQHKDAGVDPFLDSELQNNIRLALEVEAELSGSNGGVK